MSRLRTHIKNVLSTTTKADADKAYGETVSIIDKAVSKNLIHKNTGSRRKAQITRHVNSLS
jgi:small subunit ribosomal protein S20